MADGNFAAPAGHGALQKTAEENAQVAERVLADLRSRPVQTGQDYELAGEELKEIKGEFKRIDDIRDGAVRPLRAVIDMINGWFSKPLEYLKVAEQLRKSEMAAFVQRQREEQQKAIEAASAAALAGDTAAAAAALMRAEPAVPVMKGIRQTTSYKFEVTDLTALVAHVAGVKKENVNAALLGLLEANEKTIGALVRAAKGTCVIPGVKIWAEAGIAAGASMGGAK